MYVCLWCDFTTGLSIIWDEGVYVSSGKGNKAKINKWDHIKNLLVCTAKETINPKERQPTEWQKVLENNVSSKGLISKIFKESIHLDIEKTNNLIKNWPSDQNRPFFSPMKTYR